MAWNLAHIEAEYARTNGEIASENLVRTLIEFATNTNPYALVIQDAKLAGLRARATFLRNAILVQFGGVDPGLINSHIEEKEDEIPQREIFKMEKKCANCGMEAETNAQFATRSAIVVQTAGGQTGRSIRTNVRSNSSYFLSNKRA